MSKPVYTVMIGLDGKAEVMKCTTVRAWSPKGTSFSKATKIAEEINNAN